MRFCILIVISSTGCAGSVPDRFTDIGTTNDAPITGDFLGEGNTGEGNIDCTSWQRQVPGDPRDIGEDNQGNIVLVANSASGIEATVFDACGNELRGQAVTLANAQGAKAAGLVINGSELVIGGTAVPTGASARQALLLELDINSLTESGSIFSGDDVEEVWSIAAVGSRYYLSGTAGTAAAAVATGVTVSAAGSMCTYKVGAGLGRTVFGDPAAGVAFTAVAGGKALVAGYGAADCDKTPCADCPPSWTMTHQDGVDSTAFMTGVFVAGKLYLAGLVTPADGNGRGILIEVDLSTQTVTNSFTWDPSAKIDGFLGMVHVNGALYLAGGQGWDGKDWTSATSTVVKVSLPDLKLQDAWIGAAGSYSRVIRSGNDGLLLTIWNGTHGFLRRCTTSGC